MSQEKLIGEFKSYLKKERKRPETIKTYILIVKQFLKVINTQPERINKNDFEKWKDYCINQGWHDNSLTPKYASVKKFITFLVDQETLDEGIEGIAHRRLKAPKMQFDEDDITHLVLQPEQFNKVFELAEQRNPMHYAMFKIMFYCQLRRCEVIGLKISDIKPEIRKLKIRGEIAKGGKRATINISKECLDILDNYINKNLRDNPRYPEDKDILFLREGVPISKTKMWEMHRFYSQKLGFKITPHMWRHTGITEYAKKEKDLEMVRKQARHDNINITKRYINYGKQVYEESYHRVFSNNQEDKKPQPQQPQDTYIANPQEKQKTISEDEYKKYLEWKKQQDSMYQ